MRNTIRPELLTTFRPAPHRLGSVLEHTISKAMNVGVMINASEKRNYSGISKVSQNLSESIMKRAASAISQKMAPEAANLRKSRLPDAMQTRET